MDCACPKPAALTTVDKVTCKESFGQIQRVILQRAGYTFDAPGTDIKLLATWTALFAAVADTKVISTPYLENFIIPRPEPIKEGGGDNTTIDGMEIIMGAGPVTVTADISECPASVIAQLKAVICEVGPLAAIFINQYGKIICNQVTVGDKWNGFPIYSPFVTDADNQGLNKRDKALFTFSMAYGWRDAAVILTPTDFNAKTALWPA
jgi:hypothetical protein